MFGPKKNLDRKSKPSGPVKNTPLDRLTPNRNLDKPYHTDRTPAPPFDTGFVYYEEK